MADQPRRILIVDDAPDFLDFMALLLTDDGYAVATAASPAAAETAIARARPDLVICDVRMPGTAPFAVFDWLRGQPATATLPVLLCTGAVQEVQAAPERATQPHTAVLLKPFDIEVLLASLTRLLAPCTVRTSG